MKRGNEKTFPLFSFIYEENRTISQWYSHSQQQHRVPRSFFAVWHMANHPLDSGFHRCPAVIIDLSETHKKHPLSDSIDASWVRDTGYKHVHEILEPRLSTYTKTTHFFNHVPFFLGIIFHDCPQKKDLETGHHFDFSPTKWSLLFLNNTLKLVKLP